MEKYFESMVGKKINHSITTGETFFTKVYKRTYSIEVLKVKNGRVYVEVKCYDVVPSGYRQGGSDQNLGETVVMIDEDSKLETIFNIISQVDLMFLREYNIKAI
ncbi:hypothetical protein D3C71_1326390 [compost metagenome]